MEILYNVAGISRQGFHAGRHTTPRQMKRTGDSEVLQMVLDIRKNHLPGSSAREVYHYIRNKAPQYDARLIGWGKHAFEALCFRNCLKIEVKRFVPKTTIKGAYTFENLIEGMEIRDINRVWVSDICYLYTMDGKLVGYATTLIDLYSRRLLGLAFSQTMHAYVTSTPVIQQAFEERKIARFDNLIFHSDAGKQYIESNFLAAIRSKNIESSMADSCYENPFAEAFNDILKNHILPDLNINSFAQLKKNEPFIKYCYNYNRRHNNSHKMTPHDFEQHILTLQHGQRTKLKIKVISKQ